MMDRDIRFDILKALAISLVVLGHVISTRELSSLAGGRLGAFIVGMNMPLFFVISGYFSMRAVGDFKCVFGRCWKYLRAMAAYSALLAVTFYGLGIWHPLTLAGKRFISIPYHGWWFMWVLMLSLIGTWAFLYIRRFLPARRWVAVVAFVFLYAALLTISDDAWQMKYFKFCFPFFVLGYGLRTLDVVRRLRLSISLPVWILAAIFYGAYLMFHRQFPCAFYWADFNLCSVVGSWNSLGAFFVRPLVACAGIIFVALPILFVRSGRVTTSIAELGSTTMGVYFLHQCILRYWIVPHYAGQCGLSLWTLVSISVVLWLGCHSVVRYFEQNPLSRGVFC